MDAPAIGIKRYRTTIATTDHVACVIADAAAGEAVAVRVTHDWTGHSASLPPTPTNSSTAATASALTVAPAVVERIGRSKPRFSSP